jgi:hypothetical protein
VNAGAPASSWDPPWARDRARVIDLAGLIGYELDRETINTWSDGEVYEVVDYCAAVHLYAGDHDDVVIPDRLPRVLEVLLRAEVVALRADNKRLREEVAAFERDGRHDGGS